eukprot:11878-Heterococcus_DN1.PRE.3
MRQACSKALLNLSCGDSHTVTALVQAEGAVLLVIYLAANHSVALQPTFTATAFSSTGGGSAAASKAAAAAKAKEEANNSAQLRVTQRRCAATLCNLARCESNISVLVSSGAIPAIIELLKTGDTHAVKYCCAALCLIAQDIRNCLLIIDEGAVVHMIAHATTSDSDTKQSCCAVLSALSSQQDCRAQLVTCGALPALIELAAIDDLDTRLRCVIAFANLSCEVTVQAEMVQAGVAQVLSALSNSYKEESQLYCARALCNLACHHGSEQTLVQQGAVGAIMMISMVRAVTAETKQVCAKALLNMLTPETMPALLEQGLVSAALHLSKLSDEVSMKTCATIFLLLSTTALGRTHMVQRPAALTAAFELMRSCDQSTKALVGAAVTNLVCSEDSRDVTVMKADAITALLQLARLGVPRIETAVAETFYTMVSSELCRRELVSTVPLSTTSLLAAAATDTGDFSTKQAALPTIVYLARSLNVSARWPCTHALCTLAWHKDSRPALTAIDAAKALVSIVNDVVSADTAATATEGAQQPDVEVCVRAMYYLCLDSAYIPTVVGSGCVQAMSDVLRVTPTVAVASVIVAALRRIYDYYCANRNNSNSDVLSATSECSAKLLIDAIGILVAAGTAIPAADVNSSKAYTAAVYNSAAVMYRMSLLNSTTAAVSTIQQMITAGAIQALLQLAELSTATTSTSNNSVDEVIAATLCLVCAYAVNSSDANSDGAMQGPIMSGGASKLIVKLLSKSITTAITAPAATTTTGSHTKQTNAHSKVQADTSPLLLREGINMNVINAVHSLSQGKPSCREALSIDTALMDILNTITKDKTSAKSSSNSDQQHTLLLTLRKPAVDALNNLATTTYSTAGIEEGSVSALIARSLVSKGSSTNSNTASAVTSAVTATAVTVTPHVLPQLQAMDVSLYAPPVVITNKTVTTTPATATAATGVQSVAITSMSAVPNSKLHTEGGGSLPTLSQFSAIAGINTTSSGNSGSSDGSSSGGTTIDECASANMTTTELMSKEMVLAADAHDLVKMQLSATLLDQTDETEIQAIIARHYSAAAAAASNSSQSRRQSYSVSLLTSASADKLSNIDTSSGTTVTKRRGSITNSLSSHGLRSPGSSNSLISNSSKSKNNSTLQKSYTLSSSAAFGQSGKSASPAATPSHAAAAAASSGSSGNNSNNNSTNSGMKSVASQSKLIKGKSRANVNNNHGVTTNGSVSATATSAFQTEAASLQLYT